MSGRLRGLARVAGLFTPSALSVLWRAGAVDTRRVMALMATAPRLVGRGPSLGILSHINARSLGAKPAVHDRHGTLTWRELDGRANRLARALLGMGVRPGDPVATLLRNGREVVEVFLAAQKAGLAFSPLNTWAAEPELRAALAGIRPSVIVADPRHARPTRASEGGDIPMVVTGADSGEASSYEALLAARPPRPLPPLARHREARIVVLTSGTTGPPKAASRDAANQSPQALIRLLEAIPVHRKDVILCPAPLFHSFGLFAVTLGTLVGATFVLPDRFDPREALDLIDRHAVTVLVAVPVMLHRLMAQPETAGGGGSIRIVLSGGSALGPELARRVTERFGPVVYDLYGSTESGWVAVATPEDVAARPGSVGRPVPGVKVSIIDGQGRPVGPGHSGRIEVGGQGLFEGYLDAPAGDTVATGDLGRLDGDGVLWVEGRADDVIVVGGENVRPAEIEAVVGGVEGVEEVAVAGVRDAEYGHVPAAFVVGAAPEQRILDACRTALASFKVPRRIVRRDGPLPRTATGKVLVRTLVAEFEEKE